MINKEPNKYQDNDEYIVHKNINGKFEFQFGIIWTIFITFFTIIVISAGGVGDFLVFLIVFWLVGIIILKNGIKKIIADRNTELYGEECFGRICEISSIGSSNGNSFYQAKISVYVPSEGITKIVSEDIGYDYNKFKKGSYLKLRYYENDVNIKQVVDDNYLSEKIKSRINQMWDDKLEEERIDEMEIHNYDKYETDSDMNNNSIEIFSNVMPIIFGTIWLLITALCTWGFYGMESGTIFVNGEQVSHEEFNAMLGPKLFIGIFWLIGIACILGGVVNIIKNFSRNSYEDYYEDFDKNDTDYNDYHIDEINEEHNDDPIKNLK